MENFLNLDRGLLGEVTVNEVGFDALAHRELDAELRLSQCVKLLNSYVLTVSAKGVDGIPVSIEIDTYDGAAVIVPIRPGTYTERYVLRQVPGSLEGMLTYVSGKISKLENINVQLDIAVMPDELDVESLTNLLTETYKLVAWKIGL